MVVNFDSDCELGRHVTVTLMVTVNKADVMVTLMLTVNKADVMVTLTVTVNLADM